MLKGIDVSHHNAVSDFSRVKAAGIEFVYIKASEGVTYRDPQYQPNANNAMKAGLLVGFYHFARPDNGNKPEDEAQNFVNAISIFKYNLMPVLDLEVDVNIDDDALYQWARSFVNIVKAKTGYNVMLYTGLYYLNKYPALQNLKDLPLWIAAYRSTAPSVSGWANWTVWQYTDNENIPGIVESCDANYLNDLATIFLNKPVEKPILKRILKLTSPMMRGDDVKTLQIRLQIPADGIFGPLTEQAVKNWQRVHDERGNVVPTGKGLKVDGIVGPKTWHVLFK
ncbi:hypothetical protein H1164_07375 [Thermoactinomyces daqus]|uniref:Peptidoglycan binding-like domain-containing protein n=1 Tax=Thermoactinomyces daqus TaxID=1329516 RepID=A0A7W1X9W3_9BACL|nr:GH25 family lysozyme [Thermoactinomyces daqus]MBA4542721.1 hypothetical protein [Thermoactinomyces daqus]